MRIAIYHNLPSGGAKRTLMEATRRLVARHEVDVYTLSCAEHEFADVRPLVRAHRVYPFEALPLLESPWGRLNQVLRALDLRRLRRVTEQIAVDIERGGYDVVFVHPCRFEQGPSLLRALRRTPTVYYCQEALRLLYESIPARPYDDEAIGRRRVLNRLDPLPAMYRALLRAQDRRNAQSSGTVLVNSKFMAGTVADIYQVGAQVSYLGVDVDQFRPTAVERRHVVLSVGSLTPLKGFDFLIRAMAEYPGEHRPGLVIVSNFQNPPERSYLQRLATELGVELTLAGNVSEDDLVRFYNEARAVVYAPVREPFGLVPLEAMACGRPVVAVAEGGVPETVVDRHTGLLVDRDPGRFATAVQEVVEDEALAGRFGERGREHVLNHWTWERAVASLETHLRGASPHASSPEVAAP